jgi:hypothetical protein
VQLGVILDGVVLVALVRVGEEKDRRPGKPVPAYVFVAYIRNFGDDPILRVRIYDNPGACQHAAVALSWRAAHATRAADATPRAAPQRTATRRTWSCRRRRRKRSARR